MSCQFYSAYRWIVATLRWKTEQSISTHQNEAYRQNDRMLSWHLIRHYRDPRYGWGCTGRGNWGIGHRRSRWDVNYGSDGSGRRSPNALYRHLPGSQRLAQQRERLLQEWYEIWLRTKGDKYRLRVLTDLFSLNMKDRSDSIIDIFIQAVGTQVLTNYFVSYLDFNSIWSCSVNFSGWIFPSIKPWNANENWRDADISFPMLSFGEQVLNHFTIEYQMKYTFLLKTVKTRFTST